MDLKLPDLGEGIDTATVTRISVNPGDTVAPEQTLLEVETEKTTMPIPASVAGRVARVLVKPGEKIRVGTPIVVLDGAGSALEVATSSGPSPATHPTTNAPTHAATAAINTANNGAPGKPEVQTSAASTAAGAVKSSAAATVTAATAARLREFQLPDLGEGIETATVSKVAVKPGDAIEPGTTIVEVETEKTSVAVPVDVKARVAELRVKAGEKIRIGAVIAVLQVAEAAAAASTPASTPATLAASKSPAAIGAVSASVSAPAVRAITPPTPASSAPASLSPTHPLVPPSASVGAEPVPAGPATRRLARELGINLAEVRGSGRGGRVTIDDLKDYVRQLPKPGSAGVALAGPAGTGATVVAGSLLVPPLPDFSKFGPVERKPFSTLRKTIARNLTLAWTVAPAVTQHEMVDISDLEAGRKRFVEANPKLPKVTMTALAVKACVGALRALPQFNSSYDPNAGDNGELILKKYINIGIAVDTPRGLVVPVIKDADKKTLLQLAEDITALAGRAREGKLTLDDQRGGTFTITNLGGIGGSFFSPIVNYPEVAILGMSRAVMQPVWRDNKFEPRLMMPLSLSYDHRVVDGADGARFIALLSQLFADPVRLLMEC